MFSRILSLVFSLLLFLAAPAAGQGQVLNIAVLGASFSPLYGEYFSDVATASDAGKLINPLVPYAYQTIDHYVRSLNNIGGIPLHDAAGNRVQVNFRIFNINLALVSDPVALYTHQVQLAQKIVTGGFGVNYQVIMHVLTPIPSIFAAACEASQSCVFIFSYNPPPSLFICNDFYVNVAPMAIGDTSCQGKKVGFRRFNNMFSPLPSYTNFLESKLAIWRSLGVRRFALITNELEMNMDIYTASKNNIRDLNMEIVYDRILLKTQAAWTDADADAVIQSFMNLNVDAFIFYAIEVIEIPGTFDIQTKLLQAMKRARWFPKSMALVTIDGNRLDPDLAEYVWQSFQWDFRLKGQNFRAINSSTNLELYGIDPSQPNKASPELLAETFKRDLPDVYSYFLSGIPVVIQAINIPQKFIELSGTMNIADWLSVSKVISMPTPSGLLQFDGYGRVVTVASDIIVAQIQYNPVKKVSQYRVVAPVSISEPAVFPAPEWSLRTYTPKPYEANEEFGLIAATSATIALSFIFIALTIRYWRSPEVKAATPSFLLLFSFGAILLLASNYFGNLDPTNAQCATQIWLFTCGFTIMFGALFLKTLRISIIFNASQLKVKKIPTYFLALALLGLVGVDVIINGIWQGMGGMQSSLKTPDPYRPALSYRQCAVSSTDAPFLYITIAYKAILMLFGIVLAWNSRHVDAAFNESRYLAASIYAFALVSALFVSIIGSNIGNNRSQYVLICIGVLIVSITSLNMIFAPKFYDLIRQWVDARFNSLQSLENSTGQASMMTMTQDGKTITVGEAPSSKKVSSPTVKYAAKPSPMRSPASERMRTSDHSSAEGVASGSFQTMEAALEFVLNGIRSASKGEFNSVVERIQSQITLARNQYIPSPSNGATAQKEGEGEHPFSAPMD